MTTITADPEVTTVIATVRAEPALLARLADHARAGLARFPDYPGFLGGALHVSDDGERLVQYLRWTSAQAYRDCIDDPDWDRLPSTAFFADAVRSGKAVLDVTTYRVTTCALLAP